MTMSNAKAKTVAHKTKKYRRQNGHDKLTVAQTRQLRKTGLRLNAIRNRARRAARKAGA
jgi:hypothetical protein